MRSFGHGNCILVKIQIEWRYCNSYTENSPSRLTHCSHPDSCNSVADILLVLVQKISACRTNKTTFLLLLSSPQGIQRILQSNDSSGIVIFWVMKLCSLVGGSQHFGGTYRLYLQGSFEILVNIYIYILVPYEYEIT